MASKTMYELEILLGARKASSFSRNINDAKSSIGSITSVAKKVGVAATAGLAVAGAGAVAAMNTFQDFEQEMANTAAIAGASEFEYQKMEKAAREAGKSTTKTAQESAAALGYMSLAGWDVNKSTSALVPVLKLSESTQMDLATTSDLVTDSMSALGLKTYDLLGYLDIVAQENNKANTTSEQLMQAYIRTGGAARTLGADLLDTSTAIGVLANNGTKGEKAGTAMNAMLTRLASNDAAQKQLKKLKVSIFDSKGEFIGLEESLTKINTALDGMSTKKQAQALKDIAGTQYYSKMAYLLDAVEAGADGAESAWDSLESELESSNGALEKMNDRVTDTAEGALARMNSALDDMKISLADSFDGEYVYILNSLAETFNNASESIADFAREHEVEIHQFVTSVTEGIETVVDVGSNAVSWLVKNSDVVSSVMAGMGTAFVGAKAARGAQGLFGALGGLNDAFHAISNSPGKAGKAITSLGSGAGTAKTAVDALTDSIGKGNSIDMSRSFSFQSVWPENSIIESNNSIIESVKTVGKVADDVTDGMDDTWKELKLLTKGAGEMGEAAGKMGKAAGGSASKLTSLISPVTLVTVGAVALSAAIAGLVVHHVQAEKKMAKANLEEHFGNLSLSLETLDETAQKIVGKRQLTQISDMLESMGKTDAAIEAMADSMRNVSEIRWKMNAGIKLDQDDKETYQKSIEEYVNQAQEAVESKGYTVHIATEMLLGKNSNSGADDDAFFSGLDSELDKLEKKLNKKMEKAVENGVDIKTDKTIQKLLGQINEITSAVTEAENEASLQAIQLEYSGKDLSPADFKQLSTDISKYEQESIDGFRKAYADKMGALNTELSQGYITQDEYDIKKAEADAGFYSKQAEAVGNGADYILRTIEDTYPKVRGKMEGVQQAISSGLNDAFAKGVTGDTIGGVIDSVIDEAMAENGVTDDDAKAIKALFQSGLGDVWNQMDILKGQMQEKGVEIPEEFAESFRNVESLSAITGATESALILAGETISDSPEHTALVSAANEMGHQVDEAVIQGIGDLEPEAAGAVKSLITSMQSATNGKFELNGTLTLNSSIAADAVSAAGKTKKTEKSNKTTEGFEKKISPHKIHKNASGGIYDSPILTSFAELGPEAAIPLDGSDRAKSLWSATGEILGMRPQEDTHVYRTVKAATRDSDLYARTVQATSGGIGIDSGMNTGIAAGQEGCHITYSPKIVIQGNADAAVVSSALEMSQSKFEEMMHTYMANQKRFSFRAK